ncbi:hypothetical protein CBS9595_000551 [Malassezia furfur]|nr:hypothetical protein CBS9595_000551 [Malassezia furfur]
MDSAAQGAAAQVPQEVWERVLLRLDAHDIASRTLYHAGTSLSLWRRLCARLVQRAPLPAMPRGTPERSSAATEQDTQALVRGLEYVVLFAERLGRRWDTRGAQPRRVLRIRAHVNRISALKLVVGETRAAGPSVPPRTEYWLVTGSVDGYVRVWDVNKAMADTELDVTHDFLDEHDDVHTALSTDDEDDDVSSRRRVSTDGSVSDDPANEIRRHARACLVAEVDTGGDVTSLDAQLHPTTRTMRIAVGSYYSSASCLLYDLRLRTRPYVLDLCASLDPPQWSGTQCVSLLNDTVAVGTYLGSIQILDARSGLRTILERAERGSIAAIKLFPAHVLSVTRTGQLEVYALPPAGTTAHLMPMASLALAQRALLSVAISEPDPRVAGVMPPLEAVSDGEAYRAPLSIVAVDQGGLSHFVMPPTAAPFPYALPTLTARISMPQERLIGASVGASGRRAVLVSSLGGVLPKCAVRSYCVSRADDERLVPLRPTPDTDLPVTHGEAPEWPLRSPTLGARPVRLEEPRRPRIGRVDSFSSSTSTSSAAPSPSSRFDMLTEAVIDEARGVLCLASVRGAVWISDYGTSV